MDVLNLQDDDEIVAGYLAGFRGEPAPGTDKSRGYHHGYANGQVDSGRGKMTPAQGEMARAYVASMPRPWGQLQ